MMRWLDVPLGSLSLWLDASWLSLYSFLVMCLAIVESLIIYSMCKAGRKAAAERVDRAAQWSFPILYFLGLSISYLYYISRY